MSSAVAEGWMVGGGFLSGGWGARSAPEAQGSTLHDATAEFPSGGSLPHRGRLMPKASVRSSNLRTVNNQLNINYEVVSVELIIDYAIT